MPDFDLHNVIVLEDREGIKACLGYWDHSKVRRYTVEKMNRTLRTQAYLMKLIGLFTEMPRIPKPGELLLNYGLAAMALQGFREHD